jgi:hypothetical protein
MHRPEGTPAALWRANGQPDPHCDLYGCDRARLAGGHLSDDEVAFKVAMLMRNDREHEAILAIARDRIRWLSRKLVECAAAKGSAK